MKLRKVTRWCDAAETLLASTLTDERDAIVADVNSGRCELWEVNDGSAWLVTCVADGELALCCVAGEGLDEIARAFISFASAQGLLRIRWFTKRPALKRLLARAGIEACLQGYVFTVELQDAQRKQIATDANLKH